MYSYKVGDILVYHVGDIIYIEILEDVILDNWTGLIKILYSTNKYHLTNSIASSFNLFNFNLATEEDIKTLNKLLTFQ